MVSFEYDINMDAVVLAFKCSRCGSPQRTKPFRIPLPDLDNAGSPDSYINYEHECSRCQEVYNITLYSSIHGGEGEIHGLNNGEPVGIWKDWREEEEEYYNNLYVEMTEEVIDDRNYILLFHVRMLDIIGLVKTVDNLSEKDKNILYPMFYVNMIASMEAYLADTFIKNVLENEERKRKFVETFKDFEKEQISFQRIYEKMDGMDKFISKTLRDVIYHNLGKVKGMYKDALGVDLGDIKELMEAVNRRHDIVHRNCVDKEGNDLIITKEDVEELYEQVLNFVDAIYAQIHPEPTV